VADAVGFPGLWRFMGKYPSLCSAEIVRSLSKTLACRSLQKLVPALTIDDLQPGGAGVRAQAIHANGTLIQDVRLEQRPRALHGLNAPSPAAAASLAIARERVDRLPFASTRPAWLSPT
jgi:(S)-2-hydroxyglutarate dehydrogenase